MSYANTSALKGTEYTAYFSVDYEILKNSILESYKYVDKVISKTEGSAVVEHEVISEGVTVSTYANGAKVYVNKSQNDYSANGITVSAMDYMVKG